MKKKKLAVAAFVTAAALTLGIGYAALSDSMQIDGTMNVNGGTAFDADIYFTSAGEVDATGYTATIATDKDKASFTVSGLSGAGESVTIPFVISNFGDNDAWVSVKTAPNASSELHPNYGTIYTVSTDLTSAKKLGKATVSEGNTTATTLTVNVTVTMIATPEDPVADTFTVMLDVTSTEPTAQA